MILVKLRPFCTTDDDTNNVAVVFTDVDTMITNNILRIVPVPALKSIPAFIAMRNTNTVFVRVRTLIRTLTFTLMILLILPSKIK